ncbi:MAG: DUF1501 domain-containing protein [Verrucomicrobiota bacterium]
MKIDNSFSRRRFVERCAQSAFGLAVLPGLAGRATADDTQIGFGKAKRIIFINIGGGMSHIDTFDPKDGDTKGPGSAIKTAADFQVTEYLPEIAKVADRLTVIRSMTAKIGVHRPASYFMRTAFAERNTVKHPNLGAWAEHYLGPSHDTLPSSACINQGPRHGNGFFPPSYSPIPIHDPERGVQNIDVQGGTEALKNRLALSQDLSTDFMSRFPDANTKAYQEFYDATMRLLRSKDLEAFDLSKESKQTRERYGEGKFGQGCLLARRLVEAGIRYVEVTDNGWDMHTNLEAEMEEKAPPMDKAYAALIQDLESRGLLDSTLVALTTEFGRKPEYSGNGRNHYPICFTTVLAGGGVKRGYVHGSSGSKGDRPSKPVTVPDFHATIGWAAGLPLKDPAYSP